ncbi:MAG: AAA family ATPase [Candidatus Omnitrophica bacterium]|nr:AAA family ATPase [Candidatus Omnitrophota bacterium]
MVDKRLLKQIALEQWETQQKLDLGIPRQALEVIASYLRMSHAIVISGMRRAGKSTLLAQIARKHYEGQYYYFNFEDERLLDFKKEDFNHLFETLVELFGEKRVFFLDEIQNVVHWEVFVRRMMERGHKFFITGSNASLLSRELGTRLTGRSVVMELYPLSFREFLSFKKFDVAANSLSLTVQRAKIKRYFQEYAREGGIAEYHKFSDAVIIKGIYDDILYRDIVARHDIKDVKALRELSLYYLTNVGGLFSYNNLKKVLRLGSENTVKSYTDFLQDSYLMFAVPRFSYSLKQQFLAQKKIYCVDNGIISTVAFQFSKNRGKYLENLVFIELKRRGGDIFYFHGKEGREIDFMIKKGIKRNLLIQVTESLTDPKVRQREISALTGAMKELGSKRGLILTEDEHERLKVKEGVIDIKPVYEWLLESSSG